MTVQVGGFTRNARIGFGDPTDTPPPWYSTEFQLFNDLINTIRIGTIEGLRGASYGKQSVGGHQHPQVCHLAAVAGTDGSGNVNIRPAVSADVSGCVRITPYGSGTTITLSPTDTNDAAHSMVISANSAGVIIVSVSHFEMDLPSSEAGGTKRWFVDSSGFVKVAI